MLRRSLAFVVLTAFLSACGNSGSTTVPPINTGTAAPTPTPTPAAASASGTLKTSASVSTSLTLGPIGPGVSGTTSCTPASGVANLAIVFSTTQPTGTPTVASMQRRPKNIGGANLTPFGYFTVTPDVTVTCPNTPSFAMTFPSGTTLPAAGTAYVAIFDPSNAAAGWNTIEGTAAAAGTTLTFTTSGVPIALVAGRTYSFVLFTTSSTLSIPTPTPTSTPTPTPTPSPTPTATPIPLHLYVGNDNGSASILQFNLPLTASSTPNFGIASNNVVAVAVDANGNLAVGDFAGHLQFFTAPLSGASTPAATFNNGTATNDGQIAFTSAGDFWVASVSNRVNAFTQPFSNASTPSAFVTDAGMVSTIGTAFDAAQNLYISNAGTGNAAACAGTSNPGGGCGSNIYVYAPPYTGAPIITPNVINFPYSSLSTAYRKIAVNATRLYAASVSNTPGRVDVYNLPITAASTPAFSLQSGVNTPEGLALDPSGNLYIGNLSDATVTVYTAPITASSVPSLIFKVSTGPFAIFGIAVGK
jgi:hypothetical protein